MLSFLNISCFSLTVIKLLFTKNQEIMSTFVRAKIEGQMRLLERCDTRSKSHVRVLDANGIPEEILSVDDYKPGYTVITEQVYLAIRFQGLVSPVSRVAKGVLVKLLF